LSKKNLLSIVINSYILTIYYEFDPYIQPFTINLEKGKAEWYNTWATKTNESLISIGLFTVAIGLNFNFSFIYVKNIKSPPTFYRDQVMHYHSHHITRLFRKWFHRFFATLHRRWI